MTHQGKAQDDTSLTVTHSIAPSPPLAVQSPYAVISFEPAHVNNFRIGATWAVSTTRVPLVDQPVGTRIKNRWIVADPSLVNEFDAVGINALAEILDDDFGELPDARL